MGVGFSFESLGPSARKAPLRHAEGIEVHGFRVSGVGACGSGLRVEKDNVSLKQQELYRGSFN